MTDMSDSGSEEQQELARLRAEVDELERLKSLDELLETIAGVLDVRGVFERVSEISRRVIPHDALFLGRLAPDRDSVRVWAHTALPGGAPVPEVVPLPDPDLLNREWESIVVADISADEASRKANHPLPLFGFKALLRIPLRQDGVVTGALNFVSCIAGAFSARDVLCAKRIAECIHLALTHHDIAEAARRGFEAQERARQLETRVEGLVAELAAQARPIRIVGVSREWKDVLAQASKVAEAETTVLLTGESGTGKEVVARFLHSSSRRSRGPFVALNCAALPDTLLESELFGYERGAFTGAHATKPGRIELAQGGVLFLDEVAETSPSIQAKLLRVLQEKEFQRLGGTRTIRADVRVLAATNRDLRVGLEDGSFRRDLYYRLGVFEIRIPPLRERPDDILPLAGSLLEEIGAELGRAAPGLSRDAREALLVHAWPGNVRELRNVLERASILCDGGLVTRQQLVLPLVRLDAGRAPAEPTVASTSSPVPTGSLDDLERSAIERALLEAHFNKTRAARALGLTRRQLYGRLRRLALDGTA